MKVTLPGGGTPGWAQRMGWGWSLACDCSVHKQQGQFPCIFTLSANSKQGQCLTEETSEVPWIPEYQEASPIYTVTVDVLGPIPTGSPV